MSEKFMKKTKISVKKLTLIGAKRLIVKLEGEIIHLNGNNASLARRAEDFKHAFFDACHKNPKLAYKLLREHEVNRLINRNKFLEEYKTILQLKYNKLVFKIRENGGIVVDS